MPALRSLYTVIALRDQVSEKIKTVNRRLDTYKTKLQVVRRQLQRVNTTLKEHRMHFLMVGAALGAVIGLTVKGAIDEEKYRRNIASLIGVQSKKNKILQEYITIAEELSYISKENRARLASEMLLMGASVDSIMKYGPQLEKLGISVGKTTEDVITAVRSSITGIHRPFKNLGIVIEETDVKGKVEEIRDAHEGWTEEALKTEAIMLLAYPQMTRVIGDFDVAMDSAYGDMIKFKETLSDLSGDIGGVFIPVLRATLTPITKFMGMLKEHPILRTATAISLLSGLVLTLAGLAIPMITSALSFFVPASLAAAFAAGGLTAVFATLMATILPIVAAIAAVVAVMIVLQHAYKRNLFGFADAIKKVATGVKVAFGIIIKVFKALISGFIVPFKVAFSPVLKMLGLFNKTGKESSFLVTVVNAIGGAFKRLHTFLEPHFPLIKKILKVVGALGAIMVMLPFLPMIVMVKILVTAVKALVSGIKWLIEAFKTLYEIGGEMREVLSNLKDIFFDAGSNLIKAFTKGIKSMLTLPIDAISEMGEKIRSYLPFSDSRLGALRDLTTSGGKLVSTFTEGMLQLKPELTLKMEKLFEGVPIMGEGINKLMPAPAEMMSTTTTSTTSTHTEDKRTIIERLEIPITINNAGENAEEISNKVLGDLKRQFEKYGI